MNAGSIGERLKKAIGQSARALPFLSVFFHFFARIS